MCLSELFLKQCMFFKVLMEEKKPKPAIQEPSKKVSLKPEQAFTIEEPPKKGIDTY